MGLFSGKNIGTVLGFNSFGPLGAIGGRVLGGQADSFKAQNEARAAFDPYSGQPLYPDYVGMDESQLNGAGLLNTAPMDQYTREAMRSRPSRGADLAGAEQRRLLGLSRDQLKQQALGEAAQAKNSLAMKGGLTSGAAERVNTNMGSRALELAQQARSEYGRNTASIAMEDEGNRQKMLGAAPGMQLQAAEYASKDIDRGQLENTKKNAFNLGRYGEQARGWAAGKQAQATQNAGKK